MTAHDIFNVPRGKIDKGQKINYGSFSLFSLVAKKCGLYQVLQEIFPVDYKLIFAMAIYYIDHNSVDLFDFQEYEKTNYTDIELGANLVDILMMMDRSILDSTIEQFNQLWMKTEQSYCPLNEDTGKVIVSILPDIVIEYEHRREVNLGRSTIYSHLLSPISFVPLAFYDFEENYCSNRMFQELEAKCFAYGFNIPLYLLYYYSELYPADDISSAYRCMFLDNRNKFSYNTTKLGKYFTDYLNEEGGKNDELWIKSKLRGDIKWKEIAYCYLSHYHYLQNKVKDDFVFLHSKQKKITYNLIERWGKELNIEDYLKNIYHFYDLSDPKAEEKVVNHIMWDKCFKTVITTDTKSSDSSLARIHSTVCKYQENYFLYFEIIERRNDRLPVEFESKKLMFLHFISLIIKQVAINYLKPYLENPFEEYKSILAVVPLLDQIQITHDGRHWAKTTPLSVKQKEFFATLSISEEELDQDIFNLRLSENKTDKAKTMTNLLSGLDSKKLILKYGTHVLFSTIAKESRLLKVLQTVFPADYNLIFEVAQFLMTNNIGDITKLPLFLDQNYVGQQKEASISDIYHILKEVIEPTKIENFYALWSKTTQSRLNSVQKKEGVIVLLDEYFQIIKNEIEDKELVKTENHHHYYALVLFHATLVPISIWEYYNYPERRRAMEEINAMCDSNGFENPLFVYHDHKFAPYSPGGIYTQRCLFLNLRWAASDRQFNSFVKTFLNSPDFDKEELWSVTKYPVIVDNGNFRGIGFREFADFSRVMKNMDDPIHFNERKKLYDNKSTLKGYDSEMKHPEDVYEDFTLFKSLSLKEKLFYRGKEYFDLVLTKDRGLSAEALIRDYLTLSNFARSFDSAIRVSRPKQHPYRTNESDMYLVFILFLSRIILQESVNYLKPLFDLTQNENEEFQKILKIMDSIKIIRQGNRWEKSSPLTEEQENILRFLLISEKDLDEEISEINYKLED